jgi:RNA polymerase sigma factor (sigma-70 family)
MKDTEILEHLKSDRYRKAVRGLYDCFPAVRQLVMSNSGNREDAEDIFQEALLILYKKARSADFELTSTIKTFIVGISRNLWYAELRRKGKDAVIVNFEMVQDEIVNDNEQQYKMAEMAFNLLGEKCKQLLILFYFKKKSMSEVARILEFSNEKVAKNQKYRCLEKAKDNFINLIN